MRFAVLIAAACGAAVTSAGVVKEETPYAFLNGVRQLRRSEARRASPVTSFAESSNEVGDSVVLAIEESLEKEEMPPIVEPFGKGLVRDLKLKGKWYASDIADGLNLKTLATVFFMFFNCLAPAVAFGGALQKNTAGLIGVFETLLFTAITGMAYALTSGQPMTIMASTGPVLTFTFVLYNFAIANGYAFLPVYAWVGLWSAFYLLLASAFSFSNVIAYLTRFTDEIFSFLISMIFIKDGSTYFLKLLQNADVPLAMSGSALQVGLTTFMTAYILKGLKGGSLFQKNIREKISDFGPSLGVLAGVLVALAFKTGFGVELPALSVPDTFATTTGRPWLTDIMSAPMNIKLGSAIPAIFGAILFFMDQNISVRLVNMPRNKLRKGYAYDLDILVTAGVIAAASLFGLPWVVAATVPALNHVGAMTLTKGETLAEKVLGKEAGVGKAEGAPLGVLENRVSGFLIHALMLGAVLKGKGLLALVPEAVLKGLFVYAGVASLKGNTMWERLVLMITGGDKKPSTPWTDNLKTSRIHAFTALQVASLYGLWWVKDSKYGIVFPIVIAALHPIRLLAEKLGWFSKQELEYLDGETE
uniref:Bicarbonate transporter-like transmembrane domain-containing protein n=1 Tax=Chromera velia CCMP2878 TaxID=1169474 RepID=A0A0G4FRF4_9ALVE|eukprot:Cvel_3635.t1-p1 / transcript=Cvel_3635.t1 / gene=Cvel_3635 / organism=Chromera_velia_CCMP2878 / gene_product=Band 3 anion transport protein, putative / transcript_product=Band 3 anion transport protein, putative / location=Cvel_scaffold149:97041-100128(-) / protein_length=587 / sequence_SO=supercontig / SO=protein_coding / is_pseudo=false